MPTDAVRKDDPHAKIPASVLAASAAADELHKKLYGKKDEPQDPPKDPDPAPAETKADATPPKEPTPPEDAKPAETPVTPKSNDTAAPKEQNWEHAYKSVNGRYQSAMQTVRSLNERIAQLEQTIASMQAAPPTPAPAPKSADTSAASLLTDQERQEYGDEFLSVVGKRAKQELGGDVEALRAQVTELQQRLGNTQQVIAKSDREKMKDSLTSAIPNWTTVNHDQNFHDWLALQDPISGVIRHNILKAAWGRNDTARVTAIFKGFLAEQAPGTPTSEQPAPTPPAGKVPLEQLAAPGRAKTAADTGSPAEKPILSRVQIQQFYAEKAAQKWRGRENDAAAFEQQIFAAMKEGRIQ